jgi:peptidyl-prolyl cis-trans isomerase B (cyclophilin B)
MAIAALVCAFVFAPLGIVFGHISLAQIRRTGEEGRGMALAGLIVGYVATALTIVVIVVSVLFAMVVMDSVDNNRLHRRGPTVTAAPGTAIALPPFVAPPNLGAGCRYPASPLPAAKPATPPRSGRVPTDPAEISASIATTAGNIGLQLDNGKSPCTVNSFASLAQQGFYDDTPCHRLSTAADLKVLQCGDPTGRGTGGPGYSFADEYPSNQYRLSDPALRGRTIYPRGTVAMAGTGPNRNGSQFYLVYGESVLPPRYTVFGTIDSTGLATLDKIAARGVAGGGDGGAPAMAVNITSARLD